MMYSKIEGSGKPLIIIHGFLGMSDNWKTLGSQYAGSGFEVHMVDLRNHGRSFHSDDFTYDAMANDVRDYMDHHGMTKADIIGHSMGGKVGMLFSVKHPEKVNHLVVADIGPRPYRPHHDEILDGLSAVDFSQVTSRQEVDDILAPYIPDTGTRQFLMKSLYWVEKEKLGWRFNLEAFNKNKHIIGEALPDGSRYDGPVLFIKGENSEYIRERDYDSIREFFPEAAFEVVPNAGHWLHAENPDDFFTKTTEFLSKTD